MCGLGLNHHKSHTYGDLHSFEDKVLMLHTEPLSFIVINSHCTLFYSRCYCYDTL